MENERPKGDDEKPSESKKISFLETWQQRLGVLPEMSKKDNKDSLEEDSEKEPSETKKGKRWQNLFGKVFGGIVKSAPIEAKYAPEKDTLFVQHAVSNEESAPKPDDTLFIPHESVSSSETPETTDPLGSDDNSEIPEFESQPDVPTEQSVETNSAKEALKPPTAPPDIIAALNNQPHEVPAYEQTVTAPAGHTVGERVIERDGRGVGVAAGLFGLEFLARRRADRKLKKEIKRLDQRLKSGDKQMPPRTVETNRTAIESRAYQPSTPEMKIPVPETSKLPAAEAQLLPEAEKKLGQNIELPRDLTSEVMVTSEKPEKVLEKVAKAAEKNVPIEKLFERSHEIKDEPSQHLGAAPVGAILSRSDTESQSAFTAATKKIIEAQQQAISASSHSGQPHLYKQAVKSGFWTAVVLVACIGVFMIFNS